MTPEQHSPSSDRPLDFHFLPDSILIKMTWKLADQRATGVVDLSDQTRLEIDMDAQRTSPGIAEIRVNGVAVPGFKQEMLGNLLGVSPDIVEIYRRGSDLVCRYAECAKNQLTPTVYWSLHTDSEIKAAILDMRVSVQTSTLGTQPDASFEWYAPSGKIRDFCLPASASQRLSERQSQPLSYLDETLAQKYRCTTIECAGLQVTPIIHLSDFKPATSSTNNSASLHQKLKLPLLEKGVIRTARIRCLLSATKMTDEQILEQAFRFFQSVLPLTT